MLECGQYNKLWHSIHMMPEETVKAYKDLHGNYLLPIHWGAYALSVHKWTEPIEKLKKAASEQNIKIITPKI